MFTTFDFHVILDGQFNSIHMQLAHSHQYLSSLFWQSRWDVMKCLQKLGSKNCCTASDRPVCNPRSRWPISALKWNATLLNHICFYSCGSLTDCSGFLCGEARAGDRKSTWPRRSLAEVMFPGKYVVVSIQHAKIHFLHSVSAFHLDKSLDE